MAEDNKDPKENLDGQNNDSSKNNEDSNKGDSNNKDSQSNNSKDSNSKGDSAGKNSQEDADNNNFDSYKDPNTPNNFFDFAKNFQNNGFSNISPDMLSQMMSGQNFFSNFANIFSNNEENKYVNKSVIIDTFNSEYKEENTEDIKYDEQSEAQTLMVGSDLWIDSFTNFFSKSKDKAILKPSQAFYETVDECAAFTTPISKRLINGLLDNFAGDSLMPNIGIAVVNEHGDVSNNELSKDVISQLIYRIVAMSLARRIGKSAAEIYQSLMGINTISLPLQKEEKSGLILKNINKIAKKNKLNPKDLLKFISILEMSYSRIFYNVKWLKTHILVLLEKYAKLIDVSIDDFIKKIIKHMDENDISPSETDAMGFGIDIMSLLNGKPNPQSNNNQLPNIGIDDDFDLSIFIFQTDESLEILKRIQTIFVLLQGWVLSVTTKAAITNVESFKDIYEYFGKDDRAFSAFKKSISTFTLTDLPDFDIKKAVHFWNVLLQKKSLDFVDSLWEHPDNLPSLDDILDPERFIKFGKSSDILKSLEEDINWDSEFESLLNDNNLGKKTSKDDSNNESNGEDKPDSDDLNSQENDQKQSDK